MSKARKKTGGKRQGKDPLARARKVPPRASPPAPKSPGHRSAGSELLTPTVRARELFWSNVVREILMSLWAASEKPTKWQTESPGEGSASGPSRAATDLLDGRFSVVTNTGLRVPIAQVQPVFGCGVLGKENREHWLSQAVECTVFQIRTPQGEVFTLPVHAVRAFHSLSEDAMEQLGRSAREGEEENPGAPFGFAAYTSLARSASALPDESNIDPRWIHAGE